jgi:peptidoglycan/xylan/chitin deacetylase (PgdA/CDA1 family)
MSEITLRRGIKLAISLLYFGLMSGMRSAGLARRRLTVLYYHGVPPELRLSFARQMDTLQRAARVLPASFRGELPPRGKCVAITFDDALQTVADHAIPELTARSLHSTIFVPVGLLGRRPNWAVKEGNEISEQVMSLERLKQIVSPLVELGSHTSTHPVVCELDEKRRAEEIDGSRHALQELTGQVIRLFSFPYGRYDSPSLEACRAAGYEFVFSILAEDVDTSNSEFVRGRVKVEPSDGPLEFFLKFNGAYEWTAHLRSLAVRDERLRARLKRSAASGRAIEVSKERAEPSVDERKAG